MNSLLKICIKCKSSKTLDSFNKNRRNKKDNLDNCCKECNKKKYLNNREKKLISQKKWRENNPNYQKEWRKNNPQRKEYEKRYYNEHKKLYIERKQKWRKDNPIRELLVRRKYRENNKLKYNNYAKEWKKNKRETQYTYKLKENISRRIRYMIDKKVGTEEYIGCSVEYLKMYLESKFILGMNWENYGKIWHIDHIIPCNSWNFNNDIDIFLCCNYRNLQPLWKVENIIKKDNYEDLHKKKYIEKMNNIHWAL